VTGEEKRKKVGIHIYIDKDGNSSTKSTRRVKANVNTQKEIEDHQNIMR
jgi:hypothetical protein